MIIKNDKDYIKVENLNKNIQIQIRNLCSGYYSGTESIEDLPFFCFHINFKKNILELLLKDLMAKGEVKQEDIDKLLSIFNTDNNEISKIGDVSLGSFKLREMKNQTKFNLQLFVSYTGKIINLLQESIYKKLINALCAITSIEGNTIEDLGKNFECLEEIIDDEPETFIWNELKSTSLIDNEIFYRLNSEVETSLYYSIKVLPYPKDEYEKNNKRIDKNIFINSFEGSKSIAEKELRNYYDNLYSVLVNDVAPIDSSIVIQTLSKTFRMLLKKQFGSAVGDAMVEKSKTEGGSLKLKDLGDYLGVHAGTLGERLNNLYENKISDIDELYKISYRLDKTSDFLLGLKLNEPNYEFSKVDVQQYIEDKYGLNSDTLKVLEALQESFKIMETPHSKYRLNKGLNTLLSSKYVLRTPIYSDSSFFINITNAQIDRLKNLYDKGIEIKGNIDIEESFAAGFREKKFEDIVVRYNKRNLIITENGKKIVRTNTKEEYYFNGVEVKRVGKTNGFRITKRDIVNLASIEDGFGTFFDIDLGHYRNLVIGKRETDFLTPLLNYLGYGNSTFTMIAQEDLDSLYNGFEDGEFAVDEFYQEVSTNYGSLDFETDNLILLEILTRLKNFKYEE